jgi:hypothetical protein
MPHLVPKDLPARPLSPSLSRICPAFPPDGIAPGVAPLDESARVAATIRQSQLTKPRGAPGRLEKIAIHLAALEARPRLDLGMRLGEGSGAGSGLIQASMSPANCPSSTSASANSRRRTHRR